MKKNSALILVILLLASTLLAACSGTGTDDSLERVKKAGKLTIAIDPFYPPMEYVAEDLKTYIGYDIDLAKAITAKLGVQAEFVAVDWDGILPGLTTGKYDVIMSSMNITAERQKQVNFVEYAKMSQVFVSRKGINVKSEKDLAGKVVAVQAETTSHIWADEVKAGNVKDIKEIRAFKTATDAFQELKSGRADVVVIDEPVGLYYVNLDAAAFTITGRAMEPEAIGIAIRKEDKSLQAAIEKALKDLRDDGTYLKIAKEWFGGELGK